MTNPVGRTEGANEWCGPVIDPQPKASPLRVLSRSTAWLE